MPLLRLLAAVPERGGGDAIKLGFQSLELLCSDHLAALPVEQLRRCLEVAALYARQKVRPPQLALPSPAPNIRWQPGTVAGAQHRAVLRQTLRRKRCRRAFTHPHLRALARSRAPLG